MEKVKIKLEKLRKELDQLIEVEADKDVILKKSQEVDKVINEYYKISQKK